MNTQDNALSYRAALGQYATGVCVVTAEALGRKAGITVNSFTSVSLEPPLVSWCVDEGVRVYPVFATSGAFCVHILGAHEQAVAERFADYSHQDLTQDAVGHNASGAPVLPVGAVRLDCRVFDKHRLGDHLMLVGEVLDFTAHDKDMLGYYRGRYHTLKAPV